MRRIATLLLTALTLSAQGLSLGDPLPTFHLSGVDGKVHAARDLKRPLVVVWLSTTCPAVKAAEKRILVLARGFQGRVTFVGVNSNTTEGPYAGENMEAMKAKGYPFVYLRDEEQTVVKTFGALCTPDFFLFDGQGRLAYHGRLDNLQTRGRGTSLEQEDLRLALEAVLAGRAPDPVQKPARGCSIKWKGQG